MNLNLNQQALRELERNPDVTDALDSLGGQIADVAEVAAPKRTGFGARSIHHELGQDERGLWVRVSWSRDAFYLYFHEMGTSKMNARPFLRPALDRRYTP